MNEHVCQTGLDRGFASQLAATILTVALRIGGIVDRMSRFLNDPLDQPGPRGSLPAPSRSSAPIAVLVIDASPSMDCTDWKPSRLRAAKDAARAYIARLKRDAPGARVAVVAYSQRARTVCPLTPVERSDYLSKRIGGITTRSATNIAAGLDAARSIVAGAGTNHQVVLLTDGEHNFGPKPHDVARTLRRIAVLETVGIGGSPADVDEKLLKAIASAHPDGRKRYRWIGDQEELVAHFEKLAGRLARS